MRIGIDIGGTFTDIVCALADGTVTTRKVPSSVEDYSRSIGAALPEILTSCEVPGAAVQEVIHGTTVATNAILERRGARTALVTTKGFRDVLELRRVRAPEIYNLFFDKPPPIVDRYLRFEVDERMTAEGEVLRPVREADLSRIVEALRKEEVESVAVCLLHSYAYPQHEEAVGDYLRERLPQVPVSLSCEILRERKEYERTATTAVNAYVRPVMRRYLDALRAVLDSIEILAPLMLMQSAGGLTPAQEAASRPVYVLESGPAAGVLCAGYMAGRIGEPNVISFDMGGTTAKAAMIEKGHIPYSADYEVGSSMSSGNRLVGGGGELVLAPSIDIAEVGAGGGSIAYLDAAGGLRVGPRSAGSTPGPACYGRGGAEPTVTDANVVLGYIQEGKLAGGEVTIDSEASRRAILDHIAKPLGLDLLEAAQGIHQIANARMMRALRGVSTERGRDPRDFVMVAFGGSGPVHAANLARELGPSRVIIPPMPGLFSAVGMLVSGVEHHDVRSCSLLRESLRAETIESLIAEMREPMLAQFRGESYALEEVDFQASVEVRYQGQASQVNLPLEHQPLDAEAIGRLHEQFEAEHERLYGHRSDRDNAVEVVAVRITGRVSSDDRYEFHPPLQPQPTSPARRATFIPPWGSMEVPRVCRQSIVNRAEGPFLIDEYDATIVVPPDMTAEVDNWGNLVLEFRDGGH